MPSKKLIYDHFKLIFGFQFQMEIQGIGRRRARSVDDAELGHYTFLFYRGRQKKCTKILFGSRCRRRRRRGLPKVSIISPYMVPVRQKYPDG